MESFPITKRHSFWKEIPDEKWNDWRWQQSSRITAPEQLKLVMGSYLSAREAKAFETTSNRFMMGITPYYFSLIDLSDESCPVRMQAIPQVGETQKDYYEFQDPLFEEEDMPVPGLTHRYPDRVLLYTTHNCPVYCRHCTRKRKVSNPNYSVSLGQIDVAIEYIRRHPKVRDIIISGGDPLSMSDDRLFGIISRMQEIPHVEILRIGTRNPVTLPQRITTKFASRLRELNTLIFEGKRKPVYINTHFNHPKECTPEAAEACHRLLMAGSPLGNQSVLLKGVNDKPSVMKELNVKILGMGIRPYYIYLCDPVPGTGHFRTPVEIGLEIIDSLRGHTSGFATPQLVIDAPGGGGKILIPNGIIGRTILPEFTAWKLVNFEKKIFYYLAPSDKDNYYERYRKQPPPEFDAKELPL